MQADVFDPVVIFDPHARRFIATSVHARRSTNTGVLIGVSLSEDPRGAWNLRRVQADTTGLSWADFPVVAFNDRFIVITSQMLQNTNGNGGITGSRVMVFDKTNLYAGNFSSPTILNTSIRGYFPVSNMDLGSTNMFMLANYDGNNNGQGELRFGQILGNPSNATFSPFRALVVPDATWASDAGVPNFAPQSGVTNKINLFDARMRATMNKNGSIFAAHMIYVPATNPTRSIFQYFVIQPDGKFTRGTIDDGASFFAYPNLAVNDFGDVLVGYAKFSSSIYPSAAYRIKYFWHHLQDSRPCSSLPRN